LRFPIDSRPNQDASDKKPKLKSSPDLPVCRLVYGLLSQEKSSSEVGEVVVCVKRGFAPTDGALREQRITRRAVREASSGHPEDAKPLYLPGYPHVRAAGSRPDRQGGCAGDVPQVRGLAVSRKCGPRQAVRRLRDALPHVGLRRKTRGRGVPRCI
jgi:hypothetical protein